MEKKLALNLSLYLYGKDFLEKYTYCVFGFLHSISTNPISAISAHARKDCLKRLFTEMPSGSTVI